MAEFHKLTENMRQFAKNYIDNNGNGQDAAVKAGYSEKTAASQASRMLKNVNVQEYMSILRSTVQEIFAQETKNSLITLMEIRNNRRASPSARVRASVEILDRAGYGATVNLKGNLSVAHSGNVTTTENKEIHIIQQLVNGDDAVADAIIQAMRERNAFPAIPEDAKE